MQTNVNIINTNYTYLKTKLSDIRKPLSHPNVSFGQRDLFEKSTEDIINIINQSKTDANKLGTGGEATVWKIPGTDYCLRIHHNSPNSLLKLNLNLTEQDRINHVIAKLSDSVEIKKYIKGSPVWNPGMSYLKEYEIAQNIADMPISAFNKLLKQIIHASDNNMDFDCCNRNIIVNSTDKTLTAIDFHKSQGFIKNYLSKLYPALINDASNQSQKKTTAGKLYLAALEEFQPGKKTALNISEIDFSRFANKLFTAYGLNLNHNYYDIFISTFEDIKDLKYEELKRGSSTALYGKLKVAKALIKQLFNTV